MSLSAQEIEKKVAALDGWAVEKSHLKKSFTFPDFKEALAWMNAVGEVAERLDHHPNWSNVYNRVDVELWTHTANGLTDRDFELASAMDSAHR